MNNDNTAYSYNQRTSDNSTGHEGTRKKVDVWMCKDG